MLFNFSEVQKVETTCFSQLQKYEMLDYLKLWINDNATINTVLNNDRIRKDFISNEDGEMIAIKGRCQNWKIKTLSPTFLEIAGSIHKYWNRGTNENDFSFSDAGKAINNFCTHFHLEPCKLFVKNLEFGVNLQLQLNASEVIEQIICFNNLQPIRPYENKQDCFFIEFEQWDYYLKVYDKGKQYSKRLPTTPNTLRIEVKGMNSRFFTSANIVTVEDLLQEKNLQVLGLKFAKLIKGIVFEDDSINLKELTTKDRKLYRELSNPRKWKQYRGNANSSFRYKVKRFKHIVETYGHRKIYSTIETAVNDKIMQLSGNRNLLNFLPNTYTLKFDKKRFCLSCGKDITEQHKSSLFCSAKYVGGKQAKKCRNNNSNARNNFKNKVLKVTAKGVLFDITPFFLKISS